MQQRYDGVVLNGANIFAIGFCCRAALSVSSLSLLLSAVQCLPQETPKRKFKGPTPLANRNQKHGRIGEIQLLPTGCTPYKGATLLLKQEC
jgi:hypothetical protein